MTTDTEILNALIYENTREYYRLLSNVKHATSEGLRLQEDTKAKKRKAMLDYLRRLRDTGTEGK